MVDGGYPVEHMADDANQAPQDAAKPADGYALTPVPAPAPSAPAERVVVVVQGAGPLSRPGWLTWQVLATVGVTTLITAAVLAAVEASRLPRPENPGWAPRSLVAAFRVLLLGPFYALLGIGALWIASLSLKRKLGDKRLAGARMFAAVGVFWLIVAMGPLVIDIPLLEWAIGAGAYILILWSSFRLSRNNTLLVAAIHLALWGVVAALTWAVPRMTADRGPATPAPLAAPSSETIPPAAR